MVPEGAVVGGHFDEFFFVFEGAGFESRLRSGLSDLSLHSIVCLSCSTPKHSFLLLEELPFRDMQHNAIDKSEIERNKTMG